MKDYMFLHLSPFCFCPFLTYTSGLIKKSDDSCCALTNDDDDDYQVL